MPLKGQKMPFGIENASLRTTIKEDSFIKIDLNYSILLTNDTVISVKVLNFEFFPISNVQAFINGVEKNFTFVNQGKISVAELEVQNTQKLTLNLRYQLPVITGESQLTIPIIFPDIPAVDAKQELFEAELQLHNSYTIFEAFPSADWDLNHKSVFRNYALTLQAVPSMIKLTLGKGSKPLFSTLNLVDGFVILLLTGLLFIGWKKIKQV